MQECGNLKELNPALGRQRQADLCEFEASLVYRMSSRTGTKATEKPFLGKKKRTEESYWEKNPIFL